MTDLLSLTLLRGTALSLLVALPLALACGNNKDDDDDDDDDNDDSGDTGDGGSGDGGTPDGGGADGGGADGGGADGGGGDGGGDGGGGDGGGGDGGFDGGGDGGGDGGFDGGGDGGFDGGGDGGGDGGSPDDRDGDGYTTNDCDDDNEDIHPGADELCNDVDDDCDDIVDNDPVDGDYYGIDRDRDGLGEAGSLRLACDGVDNDWDCDDSDATEPQVVEAGAGGGVHEGSLDDPWGVIQAGIDNALSCVIVLEGTYEEAISFEGREIEVWGVSGAGATFIDARGTGEAAVTFNNGERPAAMLRGFTLTGGHGFLEESSESSSCGSGETCTDYYAIYSGGGLYVASSDPTLIDLVVVGNDLPEASSETIGNDDFFVYSYGGGAAFMDSAATLSGVDFHGNHADQGGGLYLDDSSIIDMSRSWINSNRAANGGGVLVDGGTLTLANVASVWNEASTSGGGTMAIDGTLTVVNTTYGGDDAPTGGALAAVGSSSLELSSSIVANAATGEGIFVGGSADFTGRYNDVWGNAGGNYDGVTDPTGTLGNISQNPRFEAVSDDDNPSNDDWSLSATSPCIDAGDSAGVMDDPDGSRNDQGAFGGPGGDWN